MSETQSERGRARILIVDADEARRRQLADSVSAWGYLVETAGDGFEAVAKAHDDIHLVVSELGLPGMDGFELLARLRRHEELLDVPVILVSAAVSRRDRLRGMEAGANAHLSRPVDLGGLEFEIAGQLRWRERAVGLREDLDRQTGLLSKRSHTLQRILEEGAGARRQAYSAQLDTLHRLAQAAELKDPGTGDHIHRVGRYCGLLAEALELAPGEVELIRAASPLHDVGKIGVPDAVLLKAGPLSDEEWEIMKKHTILGARILEGSSSELLQTGERIALTHHERWDGEGYPYGLAGQDIPLSGRICAVADAFDALTMDRPFRSKMSIEEAFEQLEKGRGGHFDPALVDLFLARRDTIREIRQDRPAERILKGLD